MEGNKWSLKMETWYNYCHNHYTASVVYGMVFAEHINIK